MCFFKKKQLWFFLIFILFVGGGLGYWFYRSSLPLRTSSTIAKDTRGFIQQRGEKKIKQKYYAPLVIVYQNMLRKYPDNIEIKKKLAFAYFGSGDYEKAEPLLKEVAKTSYADPETFRELDFIASLKK